MGFERLGSYPGHSTLESGGDTFKMGRVNGALVQVEAQPLSARDPLSTIRPHITLIDTNRRTR